MINCTWKYPVLICALLCGGATLFAQKPADLKKAGDRAYELHQWATAREQLSKYQELKPGDPEVLTKLGVSCYFLHQADKAKQFLEYVAFKYPDAKNPDLFFYLASVLHGLQQFDRAIIAYKNYLRVADDKHPYRLLAIDNIRRCVHGAEIGPNEQAALVENLGNQVNSAGDEFAPLISVNHDNRLYYSAARENCSGGRRNEEGYEDLEAGRWCADIFIAESSTGGWSTLRGLSGLINTPRHEVALGFNATGRVLRYFRGFNLYAGEIFQDTAGIKDEYAVDPPRLVSPLRPEEGDGYPFFINDSTLLFSSRRAGGSGGLDLYLTRLKNSVWTEPRNMGPDINGPYDEITPFLAADGTTLYFSANSVETMGGFDVFKSVFDAENGRWTAPQNLGTPINSPNDDTWFSLSRDGLTAYFASDRLEGLGERDLYVAYFKNALPEQLQPGPDFTRLEGRKKTEAPFYVIHSALYENDRDLTSDANKKIWDEAAAAARAVPESTVLITVHTDETGQSKFDLYYGIKRAEIAGKALTDRGIASDRIVLRSAGPNFPLAKTVLNAQPNPQGRLFNRRVDIQLVSAAGKLPVEVRLARPEVSELMTADGARAFDEATRGLYYTVEAAVARQILNDEAYQMFDDRMIESRAGSGAYQYTAGLFKQYDKAAKLRRELVDRGFSSAVVVACINGVRISKAEAVGYIKNYPDLAGFVKS